MAEEAGTEDESECGDDDEDEEGGSVAIRKTLEGLDEEVRALKNLNRMRIYRVKVPRRIYRTLDSHLKSRRREGEGLGGRQTCETQKKRSAFDGLAVSILESFPKLASKHDEKGITALDLLASKPLSFRSGSSFLVYSCIPSMVIDSEIVGDEEDPRGSAHDTSKSEGTLLSKLISGYKRIIRVCPWIKRIDDARQKHVFARELVKRLIEEENGWSNYLHCKNFHVSGLGCFGETPSQNKKNRMKDPLILATKHGIHEMVEEILEKFPNVATTFDENGRNILPIAAQLRDRILYDYLKKTVNHAYRMMADVDKHGNTILHLTAYECKQGHFLTTHFGPINRMSWNVFWFEGKTPKEIFEEQHKDMIDKAEKAVKDINSCLMRDRILYDYLKKTVNHAYRMMADVDKHGNTILHLTAYECKQGHFLTTHFGPMNRMSWDVFWFERVQNDSHPHLIYHRNIEGKTPKEIFEEQHKDMIDKAEKAVKDINSCVMLVSTLIGTVNYAALFTIPGGFDQGKGLPIFSTKAINGREDLQLFMAYVGGSLGCFFIGFGNSAFNTSFSITACFQIFIIEGAFINSYFAVMVVASIFMTLVYMDALYLTYDYLYYIIRYSLAYRGPKICWFHQSRTNHETVNLMGHLNFFGSFESAD
ncbi:unnamed protein product [Camellia sinensis]